MLALIHHRIYICHSDELKKKMWLEYRIRIGLLMKQAS